MHWAWKQGTNPYPGLILMKLTVRTWENLNGILYRGFSAIFSHFGRQMPSKRAGAHLFKQERLLSTILYDIVFKPICKLVLLAHPLVGCSYLVYDWYHSSEIILSLWEYWGHNFKITRMILFTFVTVMQNNTLPRNM